MNEIKTQMYDMRLFYHTETEKEIFVSHDGEPDKAKWLPKSQIEYQMSGPSSVHVIAPKWLLKEKELV